MIGLHLHKWMIFRVRVYRFGFELYDNHDQLSPIWLVPGSSTRGQDLSGHLRTATWGRMAGSGLAMTVRHDG
jgi:hypothetical protein